jgi:transaldolase
MVKTLLEQLEEHMNVDCDTLDPIFINSLPIKCHDQTSNQRIVHEAIVAPENARLVEDTVKELKGQPWDEVYVTCVSHSLKLTE